MKPVALIALVAFQFLAIARAETDSSIETTFDRNKGALYALYGRQLRTNPKLSGKIVFEIDIAKDGETTACRIKSSTIKAPEFEASLCDRIRLIRFPPRNSPTTVLKPIDFFPAA